MSVGIPVIATAVGGVPEIIGQDRYGTLVPAESWENLCERMMEYVHHPTRSREKALVARNYVREVFSVDKMASNYIEVYQKALKNRVTST